MATNNPFNMIPSGPRVPVKSLNEVITCTLCKGYFIDATTIVECLHTFCRTCIVKYLEKNKYCPICDVQVHKTRPMLNLRADTTIQSIVYKVVPRLYHDELKRRKDYYSTHAFAQAIYFEQKVAELYENLLSPEETLCVTLRYNGCDSSLRYFQCPSAVNIAHIKRLIRAKYDLVGHHRVDILYNQDVLSPDLSLMDVAYIYSWKRNTPLELSYKIYECRSKKPKLDSKEPLDKSHFDQADSSNNNNWKEVQLRISESGEMSITGIQDAENLLTVLENENFKNEVVVNESLKTTADDSDKEKKPKTPKKPKTKEPKDKKTSQPAKKDTSNEIIEKKIPPLKLIQPKTDTNKNIDTITTANDNSLTTKFDSSVTDSFHKVLGNSQLTLTAKAIDVSSVKSSDSCILVASVPSTPSLGTVKTVFSTINTTKCSSKLEESTKPETLKRKNENNQLCDIPLKIPKPTILNHSLNLINNLSNNHPLKKQSNKFNRNGEHPKNVTENLEKLSAAQNCSSTGVKVTECPTKPIILNQHLGQSHQGHLGKHPPINVPSYSPKTYYNPTGMNRSNPSSNEEGKVGTNTSKIEVSNTSLLTTFQNYISTTPSHHNAPFLLNSAISSALKHPGITTFSTHLTPSTGFNHSSYLIPPSSTSSTNSKSLIIPSSNVQSTPLTPTTPIQSQQQIMKSLGMISSPSKTSVNLQAMPQLSPQPLKNIVSLVPPTCGVTTPPQATPLKAKSGTPLGYKTLRDPPKSWNAQIAKANQNAKAGVGGVASSAMSGVGGAAPSSGRIADLKSVRPAKFFKQRNMPRYLGNPASGVKPMFPTPQTSPGKDQEEKAVEKKETKTTPSVAEKPEKPASTEIKKHSIVKIDPKTLKPISEKAPESSNLSVSTAPSLSLSQITSQPELRLSTISNKDLKINTSSVSIFNPLKLQQNSPKNDRKSPKSPHSPKAKSTASTSTTSSITVTTSVNSSPGVPVPLSPTASQKRDQKQPNLTFTPPNPFVPNMTAQGLSPNQFFAPPGFPTYDPRVMAAYQSLWYSQRLAAAGFHGAFPGSAAALGMGSLGLPPPNSPGHQPSHSPGVSPKQLSITPPLKASNSNQSRTSGNTPLNNNSKSPKSPGLKKPQKETQPSKSLETALEKLTQNKVKELNVTSVNKNENIKSLNVTPAPQPSTILPPIVPNVESIVEKVPVPKNLVEMNPVKSAEDQNVVPDTVTNQNIVPDKDKGKNLLENKEKNIDNVINEKSTKLEDTASLNTKEEIKKQPKSGEEKGNTLKDPNSETKNCSKISKPTEIHNKTSTSNKPVSQPTPVAFGNVLSLTNSVEEKNALLKVSTDSTAVKNNDNKNEEDLNKKDIGLDSQKAIEKQSDTSSSSKKCDNAKIDKASPNLEVVKSIVEEAKQNENKSDLLVKVDENSAKSDKHIEVAQQNSINNEIKEKPIQEAKNTTSKEDSTNTKGKEQLSAPLEKPNENKLVKGKADNSHQKSDITNKDSESIVEKEQGNKTTESEVLKTSMVSDAI